MRYGLKALALAALLAITTNAHALLIPLGDFTRDTLTGLDWLDVTLTQGQTYDEVLAGSGGYISSGWRYATGEEVDALASLYVGTAEDTYTSGSPFLRTSALVLVLGPTFSRAYQDPDPSDSAIIATLGFYNDLNGGSRVGLATFDATFLNPIGDSFVGHWATFDDFANPQLSYFQVGSFLVRSVPEPSTLALFGLGLAGLGFSRRRKPN